MERNKIPCEHSSTDINYDIFETDFRKYWNIKFHENPSSEEPCYVMRAGERTEGRQLRKRLLVRTQRVALVTLHDGRTSLKGSNVVEF